MHIELCDVSFGYGGASALQGLTLGAEPGQVTAVVGPSGAGKSTLLGVVAGLLHPAAGDVRFDGRSVVAVKPERRQLGVVFQSYALFPHLTVEDNVAFPLVVRGARRRAARRQVAEVLERLEIAQLAHRHPHQLSGGERQRVALARALAFSPRALLLDEPLAALDARLRLALRAELAARLRSAGITVLYVTHDQEEAMALGHRVAVLRGGRLEQVGTPEELYRRPATPFVAAFIGEANFLPVSWDLESRRLESALGCWPVEPATAARFDGLARGRLMLRPEAFATAPPDAAHLRARVTASTFLGGRRRLAVEAAGMMLKVDLPGAVDAAPGQLLPLNVDLASAVLLPEFDPAEIVTGREGS